MKWYIVKSPGPDYLWDMQWGAVRAKTYLKARRLAKSFFPNVDGPFECFPTRTVSTRSNA